MRITKRIIRLILLIVFILVVFGQLPCKKCLAQKKDYVLERDIVFGEIDDVVQQVDKKVIEVMEEFEIQRE